MKKLNTWAPIAIIIFAMLYAVISFGQNNNETQYLLSGKDIKISGFGGPSFTVSGIGNEVALMTGGGGAVLFNQTFFAGLFGDGLSSIHQQPVIMIMNSTGAVNSYYNINTNFGYGGIWLGYIHNPKKAVHFAVSAKLGAGLISLSESEYHIDHHDYLMTDPVFIINPHAELELNLYRWFKINLGVGYRFVGDVDQTYMNAAGFHQNYFDKNDFSKPEFTVGLLFGGFGK